MWIFSGDPFEQGIAYSYAWDWEGPTNTWTFRNDVPPGPPYWTQGEMRRMAVYDSDRGKVVTYVGRYTSAGMPFDGMYEFESR